MGHMLTGNSPIKYLAVLLTIIVFTCNYFS